VEFIGKRVPQGYGGVAGCPGAIILAKDIAADIFANRGQYVAAYSVPPLSEKIPSRSTIEVLYAPFSNKPFPNVGSEWLVWGTKFWHWLNPLTFPIEDSRVNDFFRIDRPNSVDKYLDFLKVFKEFTLSHQEWLPELWKVDGGDAGCDNKLGDKVFYGLADLKSGDTTSNPSRLTVPAFTPK